VVQGLEVGEKPPRVNSGSQWDNEFHIGKKKGIRTEGDVRRLKTNEKEFAIGFRKRGRRRWCPTNLLTGPAA